MLFVIVGVIIFFVVLGTVALLTHQSAPTKSPRATAAGGEIVFCSGPAGTSSGGTVSTIFTVNSDGTNLKQITNTPDAEEGSPTWSPDKWQIAYETTRDTDATDPNDDHDIFVMDYDGSNQHSLTNAQGGDSPSWSPDGKHIAFSSRRNGNSDIYFMDPDGGNVKPNEKEKLMHVSLPIGKNNVLMATDILESTGGHFITGTNFHISITADSKEEKYK